MAALRIYLLVSALLGGQIAALQNTPHSNADTKPVISITISTSSQNPIKIGTPLRIKVTLENVSNHDIEIVGETRGRNYRIDVRDVNGKLAADTKLGYIWNGNIQDLDPKKMSPQDLTGNLIFGTLKVGQKLTSELDVTKLYDMNQPSKYTIQAQRGDPENPSLIVNSNKITVTVVP